MSHFSKCIHYISARLYLLADFVATKCHLCYWQLSSYCKYLILKRIHEIYIDVPASSFCCETSQSRSHECTKRKLENAGFQHDFSHYFFSRGKRGGKCHNKIFHCPLLVSQTDTNRRDQSKLLLENYSIKMDANKIQDIPTKKQNVTIDRSNLVPKYTKPANEHES